MADWWNSLEILDKIFWAMAIPASIIFVIQMIMTFAGMDSDGDLDGSDGSDDAPFQLFTFRNFVNFFLGFGWTGIAFRTVIGNEIVLVIVAASVGAGIVALVMFIFYSMSKMAQSGNMNIRNALNKTCEVYLVIPAGKSGIGKVHISIQGSIRELDAMTEGEKIATGKMVKVVDILNDTVLLVEPV